MPDPLARPWLHGLVSRLVRVLVGEHVALVGDNEISVVQGQPSSVAPGDVGHRRAGVAGADPEDRARIIERSHDGADAVPVLRSTSSAGCPPANQPIGTAVPAGTTVLT